MSFFAGTAPKATKSAFYKSSQCFTNPLHWNFYNMPNIIFKPRLRSQSQERDALRDAIVNSYFLHQSLPLEMSVTFWCLVILPQDCKFLIFLLKVELRFSYNKIQIKKCNFTGLLIERRLCNISVTKCVHITNIWQLNIPFLSVHMYK